MAGSLIRLDAWTKVQGSPTPLGATWVDSAQSWNVALYSTEATAVRLLIYGKSDFVNPIASYDLDIRRQQNNPRLAYHGAGLRRSGRILLRFQSGRSVRSIQWPAVRFHQGHPRSLCAWHLSAPEFFARGRNFTRANDGKAPLGILPAQVHRLPLPTVVRCHIRMT